MRRQQHQIENDLATVALSPEKKALPIIRFYHSDLFEHVAHSSGLSQVSLQAAVLHHGLTPLNCGAGCPKGKLEKIFHPHFNQERLFLFRNRLYLAFFLLLTITLLQASLAVWVSGVASYHVERGRVANQMLNEFIALGADKQRLKVWLAQSLLTKESPIDQRDNYLQQMYNHLENINTLLIQDQKLAQTPEDFGAISQQMKTLSILETNVQALQRSLEEKETQALSEAELWLLLIETFDNLEGLDLKHVIANAINLQRERSSTAEYAAAEALEHVKFLVVVMLIFGSITAIALALVLSRSLYKPIQQLLNGTSALAEGNLNYRLPEQGHSEFTMLSRSFNQMAAGLEHAIQKEENHSKLVEQEVAERTRQLQHALEQLQQAEQQQKRFLADVSHELRTPATAIRGEAEICLRGQDKEAQVYKDSLLRIVGTANDLSNRIDDLLMLVRGEQQLQLHLKTVSIIDFWQKLKNAAEPLLSGHSKKLVTSCKPDNISSDAKLYIDIDKMQQAVLILLDNAITYSPKASTITMELTIDEQLVIQIQDSGIGIAETDLSFIFDRYFRAENARQIRPDGLGIGLSLCRFIVEAHHGAIHLTSERQVGTSATIELPLMES